MDDHELIEWIEEQLGRPVPAAVVSLLRDDSYLHIVDESEQRDALNRARRLIQLNAGETPARTRRRKRVSTAALRALEKREALRRDAISEYWAKDASTAPEVKRFRAEILSGTLLTSDEAQDFLISPVALMFSVEQLAARNVDAARHSAKIIDEAAEFQGAYQATVRVNRPAAELRFSVPSTPHNKWDGQRPLGSEELVVRVEGRVRVRANAWPGSVIALLKRVSDSLESRHYPWQTGDAPWFILTGQVPSISVLGYRSDWKLGSHGNRVVLHIEVEPWVSVNRVAELYRGLQSQIIGGHNRPISERRIALVRFVTLQADDEGELPPWRQLLEEWNRHERKWKYDNVRNLSRDYWAGARGMLFPKYRLPFGKETANE